VINEEEVGEEIERRLAELRARADPRVFDQAVELLQLFGELYGEGLAHVMQLVETHAPDLLPHLLADELLASLLLANGLHPDDLSVPIVFMGPEVRSGRFTRSIETVDIAPTLAALLRVKPFEPLDGRAVLEVVGKGP